MPNGLNRGVLDLLVAADDRTGALEVAAALADRGAPGPVAMAPWGSGGFGASTVVVDLGSRHLSGAEAAARAAVIERIDSARSAHKIDSALRGNWPAELRARVGAHPRPIVVAAALPSAGRFVVDGIVEQHVGGVRRPIAEVMAGDPRGVPGSSRPADLLAATGFDDVVDRAGSDIARWLRAPGTGVLVPDIADAESLRDLMTTLAAQPEVLLAGTAEAVAAWAAPARPAARVTRPDRRSVGRVVVVVGSRHGQARRQAQLLDDRRDDRVTVLTAPESPSGPVADQRAEAVAGELAARAWDALGPHDGLIVVGGDTAAAVLGDGTRRVWGTLAPGVALSGPWSGDGPLAATRAGSFGRDDSLIELVARLLAPAEG